MENTWSRSEEGRLACWTSPPTERQRLTPSRLQLPHRKGTQFYLHTTDIMGLITAEVLETLSLYKMLGVHSNSGAILDLPMPH